MKKSSFSATSLKLCLHLLAFIVFITMLGAAKPVLFNEGSAMVKYLLKQQQVERIKEEKVEDFMTASLFGDGEVPEQEDFEDMELMSEEEAFVQAQNWRQSDRIITLLLVLIATLFLVPAIQSNRFFYHLLLPISAWLILQAHAIGLNGGKMFSELTLLAHATRWGAPLALWYLLYCNKKDISTTRPKQPPKIFIILLSLCCSMTFAIHGWEAFNLNPPFEDLIYSCSGLIGWEISTPTAHLLLKLIGSMDILLAGVALFVRLPKLFLWMACWGFITALSRPLALGLESWAEMAVRIANCGLPLVLYIIFRKKVTSPSVNAELDLNKNMENKNE
ncbi:MAG: hypothetical protein HRT88_16085 [Lentisphaeraceae bacterium]|nr:hypothetical protein [Lentisphaeraceae bacterium]